MRFRCSVLLLSALSLLTVSCRHVAPVAVSDDVLTDPAPAAAAAEEGAVVPVEDGLDAGAEELAAAAPEVQAVAAPEEEAPADTITPEQRLAATEALLRREQLDSAREMLAPLVGADYEKERVAELQAVLAARFADRSAVESLDRALSTEFMPRERRELLRAAAGLIDKARGLAEAGDLEAAQACIAPLLGKDLFPAEIRELARDINNRRVRQALELAQKESEDRALLDVQQGLVLPRSFGKTAIISRDSPPLELLPGPMEQLVNGKVTIELENAGVRDLVMHLSKIDGLNIIADEALTEQQKLTISVKDVPLHELLSYIARNMGIAFHLGANIIWVTESSEPAGAGPQLETRIYPVRHGFIPALSGGDGGGAGSEDTELEDVLATFLGDGPGGATYRIFKNRNLLVVKNSRENHRLVEGLLREFDKQPFQVLIEARFVTIGQSDLLEVGFDIGKFSSGRDEEVKAEITAFDGQSIFEAFKNESVGGNIILSGILGNHAYESVLHVLQESGRSKTLSAPRITVLNNQVARIRKGDKLYYFEEYDLESADAGDQGTVTTLVPSGSPTELELGITLEVKVSVGNDGKTIMLSLQPEVTQFQKWVNFVTSGSEDSGGSSSANTADDDDQPGGLVSLPKVNESMLSTSVVVKSSETVVLGGMIEVQKSRTVKKVPLLGDLPYLGVLFRHTEENEEPQNLLIFVTATILSDSGEFMDIREAGAGE